jgi:hypothetical protein
MQRPPSQAAFALTTLVIFENGLLENDLLKYDHSEEAIRVLWASRKEKLVSLAVG